MIKKTVFAETDLAGLAKQFRLASGKNRAEAARELGVSRPALFDAEERPEKSFLKLRKRIIERYSNFHLMGPEFRLKEKCR